MSALITVSNKEIGVMISDSLRHLPASDESEEITILTPLKKHRLNKKLKMCYGVTGMAFLLKSFTVFIRENKFNSMLDVVNNIQSLSHGIPGYTNGSIYITGYNNEDEGFESYKVNIDSKTGKISVFSNNVIFSPNEKPIVDYFNSDLKDFENLDSFLNLMKFQKKYDDQKPLHERIFIGGAVDFTIMAMRDGEFITQTKKFKKGIIE